MFNYLLFLTISFFTFKGSWKIKTVITATFLILLYAIDYILSYVLIFLGIPSQEITERMKTISEDNPTLYINTADGMDTMVSYISAGMFEKNGKNPEIVANIVKGVYCADKLLDKGMTPEQIAKLTEAEIDTMIEQDKAKEQHHEQEQELEEELVLEMVKKPNNN